MPFSEEGAEELLPQVLKKTLHIVDDISAIEQAETIFITIGTPLDACMKPPIDRPDVVCACLHCGPGGHPFEAIEMRWIANERMWACPCTTCGGRSPR